MADLLQVEDLRAGYGAAAVLHGLTLRLGQGRSMAVLGRNGMGKTTLLNTLVGVTRRYSGAIRLDAQDITRLPPERRAAAGIGWVPQERNIFRSLSVEENLTAVARPGPWTVAKVYALFPRLQERRRNMGDQLSGGEQQMLAVGRALVLNPRLLLLDEPTEGLAPVIVDELLAALARIMREEGMSALVVEQHAHRILGVTDDAVVLERGRIVHAGRSAELRADPAVLERYLGVSRKGASAQDLAEAAHCARPGRPHPSQRQHPNGSIPTAASQRQHPNGSGGGDATGVHRVRRGRASDRVRAARGERGRAASARRKRRSGPGRAATRTWR